MYCDMKQYWKDQKKRCYPMTYRPDTTDGTWQGQYCVLSNIYIGQLLARIQSKVGQGHVVYVKPGCPEWWEIKPWQL